MEDMTDCCGIPKFCMISASGGATLWIKMPYDKTIAASCSFG
jgi:hypothetical protein